MDHSAEKLQEFKEHHKTQFLMTQYDATAEKIADSKALAASDPEMAELAAEELQELQDQLDVQFKEMDRIIEAAREEEEQPYGVVLEVRAGAGGDEASLFALQLAEMYQKYAETKGWQSRKESESQSSQGGYKEAAFEILGADVYDALRYETGVHRVQRVQ